MTITLLVCLIIGIVLLVIYFLFSKVFEDQSRRNLEERATAVSRTISATHVIQEVLRDPENTNFDIQQYANKIKRINDVEFVVIFNMDRIRLTHPNTEEIGKEIRGGDEVAVLHGEQYMSEAKGTLGLSMRSYAPIFDSTGNQVGGVMVGIMLDRVNKEAAQNQWILFWGLGFGACIGVAGAYLLARKIKKTIFNMEPFEIAQMLEERNAMLHSAKEGIIAVDANFHISLLNDEGHSLFRRAGLSDRLLGEDIRGIWSSLDVRDCLILGKVRADEEIDLGGVMVLVNSVPIRRNGQIVGAMATFRDETEIRMLAERLSGLSSYAEALRAQTHEFRNKLHVIMGMVHMKFLDQLEDYITHTMGTHDIEVGAVTEQIRDQVMAGFILGKMSRARELGVELFLSKESNLPQHCSGDMTHHLITVMGNLLDNAQDALEERIMNNDSPTIELVFKYVEDTKVLMCKVSDNGRGMSSEQQQQIYAKGFSTKGENRGMGLYLVRLRIQEIGGELHCSSQLGKGTCFSAIMPYLAKEEEI
jgi:sensor histidine kinase regulating citrate/malate metabolism